MNHIWNLTNRIFQKEISYHAFLTMNVVIWSVLVIAAGLIFCGITGTSVMGNLLNIGCAAAYAGIIVGLFGGIVFLMRKEN